MSKAEIICFEAENMCLKINRKKKFQMLALVVYNFTANKETKITGPRKFQGLSVLYNAFKMFSFCQEL
jgi:hypothetical protein